MITDGPEFLKVVREDLEAYREAKEDAPGGRKTKWTRSGEKKDGFVLYADERRQREIATFGDYWTRGDTEDKALQFIVVAQNLPLERHLEIMLKLLEQIPEGKLTKALELIAGKAPQALKQEATV